MEIQIRFKNGAFHTVNIPLAAIKAIFTLYLVYFKALRKATVTFINKYLKVVTSLETTQSDIEPPKEVQLMSKKFEHEVQRIFSKYYS